MQMLSATVDHRLGSWLYPPSMVMQDMSMEQHPQLGGFFPSVRIQDAALHPWI